MGRGSAQKKWYPVPVISLVFKAVECMLSTGSVGVLQRRMLGVGVDVFIARFPAKLGSRRDGSFGRWWSARREHWGGLWRFRRWLCADGKLSRHCVSLGNQWAIYFALCFVEMLMHSATIHCWTTFRRTIVFLRWSWAFLKAAQCVVNLKGVQICYQFQSSSDAIKERGMCFISFVSKRSCVLTALCAFMLEGWRHHSHCCRERVKVVHYGKNAIPICALPLTQSSWNFQRLHRFDGEY